MRTLEEKNKIIYDFTDGREMFNIIDKNDQAGPLVLETVFDEETANYSVSHFQDRYNIDPEIVPYIPDYYNDWTALIMATKFILINDEIMDRPEHPLIPIIKDALVDLSQIGLIDALLEYIDANQKQDLVDQVIEEMRKDFSSGDTTAIDELLLQVPDNLLRGYLPEKIVFKLPQVTFDDRLDILIALGFKDTKVGYTNHDINHALTYHQIDEMTNKKWAKYINEVKQARLRLIKSLNI
jgi:hypothetical protein